MYIVYVILYSIALTGVSVDVCRDRRIDDDENDVYVDVCYRSYLSMRLTRDALWEESRRAHAAVVNTIEKEKKFEFLLGQFTT